MSSLKKRIKRPSEFILKKIHCEDTLKKRVHKGGNKNKIYGRIYLPEEWISKEVYVGLIKDEKHKR